ncbi:hypothetical protein SAMN04244572_03810 [Azotobacter beijerinckii]|uniref:Uncharacterized protein n=1 Tax=Azotobacter beijerinckii TaxID=170623 RepID=A0A1H6YHG5_9GAMM|nr:hypothetical protein SAMN04244572_03810 [Azotobacter beijerinckii]
MINRLTCVKDTHFDLCPGACRNTWSDKHAGHATANRSAPFTVSILQDSHWQPVGSRAARSALPKFRYGMTDYSSYPSNGFILCTPNSPGEERIFQEDTIRLSHDFFTKYVLRYAQPIRRILTRSGLPRPDCGLDSMDPSSSRCWIGDGNHKNHHAAKMQQRPPRQVASTRCSATSRDRRRGKICNSARVKSAQESVMTDKPSATHPTCQGVEPVVVAGERTPRGSCATGHVPGRASEGDAAVGNPGAAHPTC